MSRNKATFVKHDMNPKRQAAKKARGFGMAKIGSDKKEVIVKWCQSHDPFFKIKGVERYRRSTMR